MSKNDKSSKENLTNTEDSTNKANNNSKNKVAENNSVTNSKIKKEKNILCESSCLYTFEREKGVWKMK